MKFPVKRKKGKERRLALVMKSKEASLPVAEFVEMVEDNTAWGMDFDPDTEVEAMRRIWEAEQVEGQVWKVTCKRRRERGGILRRETVLVYELSSFPSRAWLEDLVCAEGFGGGVFWVASTRRVKYTHRFTLPGEPEDPEIRFSDSVPATPVRHDPQDRFKGKLVEIAIRYLEQNPEVGRVVALKYLSKVLGVSIPMPELPDPDAPKPYSDLTIEEQEWLDAHPDEKDAYMFRQLGVDPPEPTFEEKMAERLLEKVGEQMVEDIAGGKRQGPSAVDSVVSGLLKDTNLSEVVGELGKLWLRRNESQAET